MKSISETNIIKQFTRPPDDKTQAESGNIAAFPSNPLDMPTSTFESSLKRREENHRKLIQWIREHLEPDVHYGRIHIVKQCPYVRAGLTHQCRDFSHYSSDCPNYNLPPGAVRHGSITEDKPITGKQKDLILSLSRRKGLTTAGTPSQGL